MNPAILFLESPTAAHNDNHERLPRLFNKAGWEIHTAPHDALNWRDGKLYCGAYRCDAHALVWPLGLGPRPTFIDRHELLCSLPPGLCINAPNTYLTMHGKSRWLAYAPTTYVSNDPQYLTAKIRASTDTWVLKPLAGSFGHQVHKVHDDAQAQDILQHYPPQYWVLQKYIHAIVEGETRTLICADQVIGSYLRRPKAGFRANLALGSTVHPTTLNEADQELITQVQKTLRHSGIRFAAIDTVGGYVMEVNIANPGGLGTLATLYGAELIEERMLASISGLNSTSSRA